MLSWSCHQRDEEIDLAVLATGHGDPGLPHGAALLRFAGAAADLLGDEAELAEARAELVDAAGSAVMVDAAAVAANFQMMTRLADGTGARYPAERLEQMAASIEAMGSAGLASRR